MVKVKIIAVLAIGSVASVVGLLVAPLFLPHQTIVVPHLTVHEVWAGIQQNQNWLIVDTRSSALYTQSHLPTAINLHFNGTVDAADVVFLEGYNRSRNVLYCTCYGGGSARWYAEQLIGLGMQNVYYMNDSILQWPYTLENNSQGGP
ncbi:MAG: rhodanese-like domain-containing protein [Candidatus Thorarchaeota archaeon]